MPEQADTNFNINSKSFWENYIKGRPQVPQSFWDRVFEYHSKNCKPPSAEPFGTVNDIGAGPGVHSQVLAKSFSHVIVTDPSKSHLEIGHKFLEPNSSKEETVNDDGKYTFKQSTAEETMSSQPASSVDMVFVANALHWTKPELAFAAFAHQLKPGGTLVIALFAIACMHDKTQQAIITRLYDYYVDSLIKQSQNKGQGKKMIEVFGMLDSAYDSITFPQEFFRDVQRIKLNKLHPEFWDMAPNVPGKVPLPSVVDPKKELLIEERDEGWFFEMNLEELKSHMDTRIEVEYEDEEYLEGLWKELEACSEDGIYKGYWPVSIILATRR